MKNEVFSIGQKMAKWDQSDWEFHAAAHARWSEHLNSSSETIRELAARRIAEAEAKYPQLKTKE